MSIRCVLLFACLLALAAPATASAGFVQRSGTNLALDGTSFRFVGHNNYGLTSVAGQYTCGRALSDATLDGLLAQAKSAGATVIRTWFFQSYTGGAGSSYGPFDRVLTRAAAKGLKVVPVLVNHYPDCEPSGGQRKDEGFYDYGYRQAGWGYARAFKDYARRRRHGVPLGREDRLLADRQRGGDVVERRLRDRGRGQRPPALGEHPAALRRRHGRDDQGRRPEPSRIARHDRYRSVRSGGRGVPVRARLARDRHVRVSRLRPRDPAPARRRVERLRRARVAVQRARQADADRRIRRRRRRRPPTAGRAARSRRRRCSGVPASSRRSSMPRSPTAPTATCSGRRSRRRRTRPTTSTTAASASARPTRSTP